MNQIFDFECKNVVLAVNSFTADAQATLKKTFKNTLIRLQSLQLLLAVLTPV